MDSMTDVDVGRRLIGVEAEDHLLKEEGRFNHSFGGENVRARGRRFNCV